MCKLVMLNCIKMFLQTLYLLKTRIEPGGGGELCRASSICLFTIIVEQVGVSRPKASSIMYEVIINNSRSAGEKQV